MTRLTPLAILAILVTMFLAGCGGGGGGGGAAAASGPPPPPVAKFAIEFPVGQPVDFSNGLSGFLMTLPDGSTTITEYDTSTTTHAGPITFQGYPASGKVTNTGTVSITVNLYGSTASAGTHGVLGSTPISTTVLLPGQSVTLAGIQSTDSTLPNDAWLPLSIDPGSTPLDPSVQATQGAPNATNPWWGLIINEPPPAG